jgi:1,4-dihydroxy-2-naphthoate octaprenyltransferase
MRVPFLLLTPACVLLGLGTAVLEHGPVNPVHAVIALIGALTAHISVNAFNEVADFTSGLDFRTERTPFSGGSGTLPQHPEMAGAARLTAWGCLALTGAVGFFFLTVRGWLLLPLGVLGLALVVSYSTWLVRRPLLCLIAPGLGFGPFMVVGTHFALTGAYSWAALTASMVPFFLVSDLLLLNQFPDVAADRGIGRRHLPIVAGNRASSYIYGVFLLLAYATIVFGVTLDLLPAISLLGLATLVLAVPAFRGAVRYNENIQQLLPSMGLNVLINIATPVLMAVGMFLN